MLRRTVRKTMERTRTYAPPVNREMRQLDRSFFKREVPLVAARLGDPSYIAKLTRQCEADLLQLRGVGRIVDLSNKKGVLLKEEVQDPADLHNLSETAQQLLSEAESTFERYTLTLDYSYWRAEEILNAVLPEDLLDETPSGYTNVGHIAHMNLREEFLPYKGLIGQVILDKNPSIKTVVNKLDSIDTVYRTFAMEVVAGEERFMVEQSESGCRFRFDFSKVYWNSRLHTEHDRLVSTFGKGQAVCDVMAGVGPFAVPAGKKGVIVLANDLNPDSYAALVENVKINRVKQTVYPANIDGRKFIRESIARLTTLSDDVKQVEIYHKKPSRSKPQEPETLQIPRAPSHYVMNLPDSAMEFLDGFIGLYADSALCNAALGTTDPTAAHMPLVHVHCFYKWDPHAEEPTQDEANESMRQRISKNLHFEIDVAELSFHRVRKVAPTKTMYCVSFRLPLQVALSTESVL